MNIDIQLLLFIFLYVLYMCFIRVLYFVCLFDCSVFFYCFLYMFYMCFICVCFCVVFMLMCWWILLMDRWFLCSCVGLFVLYVFYMCFICVFLCCFLCACVGGFCSWIGGFYARVFVVFMLMCWWFYAHVGYIININHAKFFNFFYFLYVLRFIFFEFFCFGSVLI